MSAQRHPGRHGGLRIYQLVCDCNAQAAPRRCCAFTSPLGCRSTAFTRACRYTNEYPTGRYLRDAKLYEIGAGTSGEFPGSVRFLLLPTGQFTDAAMESCWWQLRGDVPPSSPCPPPLQRSAAFSLAGSCSSRRPDARALEGTRAAPGGCMPSAGGGSSRWWLGWKGTSRGLPLQQRRRRQLFYPRKL